MVLARFNQPLEAKEVEIPKLEKGQILVKIAAAGVCGSDVHMWRGEDPRTPLPIILGHEGVGTVVEMKGAKTTVLGEQVAVGDLILWNRGVTCGECYYCAELNEPWLCQNRQVYGINKSSAIAPYLNGCYSEYMILTAHTDLFKLDKAIDPAIMVSASCSGATVAHAFDTHSPKYGDTVLVQGPGPLGLYATAFAKNRGASQIIVIGGSGNRLEMCREFGATHILNRRTTSLEERHAAIMNLTQGRGVDMALEAVGDPSAVHEGLKLVRPGGAYLSVGFSQPPGLSNVDFFLEVVRKNLKIQGVWVSSTRHTYQAMKLVENNRELFAKMITHKYSLDQADDALAVMASHEALKAVLIP